jgi:hypothetical protein
LPPPWILSVSDENAATLHADHQLSVPTIWADDECHGRRLSTEVGAQFLMRKDEIRLIDPWGRRKEIKKKKKQN